ncbi:MAG TPA: TIGR04290 family methyltransferase [Steroidobacter sp.]|nr:TIGR04290 family methyltransferase [Steroidobacter sp.]
MRFETLQTSKRREIEALGPWFHNLHLPDGLETAPDHRFGDFPQFKWRRIADSIPQSLADWSVLDIGCNAGFYSIELGRRGATVLGLDREPLYLRQARWAAKQCGLEDRLTFIEGNVYELLKCERTFDLVWFTGVFYHLRYPTLALDLVRGVTGRLMMFQSMTMPGGEANGAACLFPNDLPLDQRETMRHEGWPKMAFIEHRVAGDATNWWAPNEPCVEALLRSAGFQVISRPEHEFFLCKPVSTPAHTDLAQLRRSSSAQPSEPVDRACEDAYAQAMERLASFVHCGREQRGGRTMGQAIATTDHEVIRRWVESRKGHPAVVKTTEGKRRGGSGLLRIDFEPSEESLDALSWDDFFETFDTNNLAFLYQERTASGRKSRFNKFVSRDSVDVQNASSGADSQGTER